MIKSVESIHSLYRFEVGTSNKLMSNDREMTRQRSTEIGNNYDKRRQSALFI